MKKLFYFILIILVMMVIISFVRKGINDQVPAVVEESEVEDVIACDCDASCACDEKDPACVCAAQRAACDCNGENGDGMIVSEEAEDVVEENPEETSHEDETILKE